MPLWVTFPFDPAVPDKQPEVLARVTRCEDHTEGASMLITIAVHFESLLHAGAGVAGGSTKSAEIPNNRSPLSIPVRVRPEHVPWFEETMTLDVSCESLRFVSNRVYSPGETLRISFPAPESSPWRGESEHTARILHVESISDSNSLAITVQRIPAP